MSNKLEGEMFEGGLEGSNFESEQEFPRTRVVLDFFRHDEKDSNKTEPIKPDTEVELTPKGKISAKSHGELSDITYAISAGTDRVRARQTAMYHMAGKIGGITGAENPEELVETINAGREYGSKIMTDNRLNFNLDAKSTFGTTALARFKGGDYLKFMVEESDKLAEELSDKENSTYSRQAGGIAEIVKKYIQVGENFDRLYQTRSPEERKTNELQRFFGSHQGVTESFLAKLIEKTRSIEERDRFVELLGNQGFGFSEGFDINIEHYEGLETPAIKVLYKKEIKGEDPFVFEETISPEIIDEIIAEVK